VSTLAFVPRAARPRAAIALVAALSLAAWATLALWAASPYARYAGHAGWTEAAGLAALCRAVPGGSILVPALLHALAWVLMIAAMMLPTVLPLVRMFRRLTGARADAGALLGLLVAGFLAAWLAFGVLAHALDALVLAAAARSGWLLLHAWVPAAVVLALAGAFQFSALKYRCLEQCRTPLGFVTSRWRGVHPRRDAVRVGFDHGVFCVGCCWALMLVMFVVGMGSIGWMMALAAFMAAEKNAAWGRRLRAPLGFALIGWAMVLVGVNT
jgi:predicted metal-binding membrane protein